MVDSIEKSCDKVETVTDFVIWETSEMLVLVASGSNSNRKKLVG